MDQFGNLRRGTVIEMDGQLCLIVATEFRNPGNWRAILQIKLKNLKTGAITEQRVRPQDKVEVVFVETREMQYLYSDANYIHLMDTQTFDQVQLPLDAIGDDLLYLVPNMTVSVKLYDGEPISVELPTNVQHEIKQTDPSIKGSTAQAQYKPAVTETGLKIMVPPFIKEGDVVEIDTRTGEYLSRANKG